ncbi:uncharacterized protein LOC129821099 [Salvelinus fontinalis]|uniref:uncharacterized protein LOC129821099 n=1 Tax=Salvelinus fontinalis TaxID=8038 RepID=UPI002486343A|nr:uncharacterized protein LOC129821099 [Salvelinus fontinalis]XP_055734371.1 uncharacterized protein LOC129821099 [Salvelinus fontinalis]
MVAHTAAMPDVKAPLPCDYPSAGCSPGHGPAGYTCTAGLTMDLEPCLSLTDLPLPHPLSGFRGHSVPPYPPYPGQCPVMPRCNSSALLTNLGLRYCSTNSVQHPPRGPDSRLGLGSGLGLEPDHAGPCVNINPDSGTRLYRSMENLNWSNSVSEPGLYSSPYSAPHRGSMDSEFIFRCTATSHWYDVPPVGTGPQGYSPETLAFYPNARLGGLGRKELPLFPQWLFPGVDDWGVNATTTARKGLREKLRLQSARAAAEPLKPLRPQITPGSTPPIMGGCSERDSSSYQGYVGKPLCVRRITSPEEIKKEVLRRLQLRRQNSTPNLTLHASPETPQTPDMTKSYTTESISVTGSCAEIIAERKKPPMGRLHIPTFEEFKRMRQREGEGGQTESQGNVTTVTASIDQQPEPGTGSQTPGTGRDCKTQTALLGRRDSQSPTVGLKEEERESSERIGSGEMEEMGSGEGTSSGEARQSDSSPGAPPPPACHPDIRVEERVMVVAPAPTASAINSATPIFTGHTPQPTTSIQTTVSTMAICTGPTPRSPLQPSSQTQGEGTMDHTQAQVSRPSVELSVPGASSVPFPPPRRESAEGPSSCCPALLLDRTDLSSYGAKIYKMKEGFIGSALDLIKKSCSAEIAAAEAPVRLSGDQDESTDITAPPPDCHSSAVSMTTTTACGAESCDKPVAGGAGGEELAAECLNSGLGCRRSSSDAAYEPAESVRAQRECRLRPHYSDPMPADATKRKQLEMKIAAAACLHSQRRDRDSAPASVRVRSEPRGEERLGVLGVTRAGHNRWSTVSSLSADSGVVGLCDDRDDDEDTRRVHSSGGAEVERVDSGIGPCLARSWKRPSNSLRAWEAQRPCPDCGQRDGHGVARTDGEGTGMCERCSKLRTERKEAILEFLNTESSYGEDLRIIKEEFYCPMQSAGLLTSEQLTVVFSNVQELIDVNERFTEHLQDSIDQAFDQGDEDLLTVCIGEIFLEFVNMLPAFQTYCLQQSTSVNMLNTLEKEKELLRIFLDVSQNDNTALRRMNLRSFLMAPLQRVTKYPLLLSRISKATTECHPDHARLREAKSRVESHLEHINMKTKQEGTLTWSLRSFRRDSRKNREVINIEMREMSMKTVGWARENTRFVMEGPLQLSQPADGQWVKKGSKGLKFQNVQSLLMVRTQRPGEGLSPTDGGAKVEQQEHGVWDGVLVLIKDKSSGKFTVLREPIRLANCVVSADPDCEDTFEVLDIRKEAFVFRASDKSRTQQWFRQIKRYTRDLGPWRKRRNALPNIMINTNQGRS